MRNDVTVKYLSEMTSLPKYVTAKYSIRDDVTLPSLPVLFGIINSYDVTDNGLEDDF